MAATILIIGVIIILYFLPSLIAYSNTGDMFSPSDPKRRHKHAAAILALNIFLGWTFIGWVIALVWALIRD